jgi:Ser/Thr protein kinase RdoA (MazF antagonist)
MVADKKRDETEKSKKGAGRSMDLVADVIRTQYEVGKVSRPRWLEDVHQRRHRKMIVETDKGVFLAKTYHCTPVVSDALSFQHRLSDFLHEHGVPVAHIERAKNGRGFVEADGWILELQSFVEGAPMRVSSDTLAKAGDALGRLHVLCQDFPAPQRNAGLWRFSEVPREQFEALYSQACEEGDKEEMERCCDNIIQLMHDASEFLDEKVRDSFELGLIHGDWHGGNLIFKHGKLAGIVDLEFAGVGCYLEDIAYGVSNLCLRTTNNEDKIALRVEIFLRNYEKHRSLSWDERVALYGAAGIKHVTTVAYQIEHLDELAGYTAAEWIERLSVQCNWLREQARKIRFGE